MAVEYVDVSDIHLRDINFHITRADGRVFDFSDVVTDFNWTDHVNTAAAEAAISCVGSVVDILKIGGEGSSARITAPLVDLDTGKLVRRELWQGTFEDVVDQRREGQIERIITAFDITKFLATTEEDFVFTNSSLSGIIESVCNDFSIPKGAISDTVTSVGQVISRGGTIWDMIQEAVQRHADLTGDVYYVYSELGRVNLRKQGDQTRYWVFETGESLQTARRTRSVADMINQVKIYGVFAGETDKPVVVATKKNTKSQSLYGLRQKIDYLPSAEDESKIIAMSEKILDRFSAPNETLEITGWLVPSLRAGEQIRFIDKEWGLNRIYYVESIDTQWSVGRAETVATVRREAVDPDLILEEVTSA